MLLGLINEIAMWLESKRWKIYFRLSNETHQNQVGQKIPERFAKWFDLNLCRFWRPSSKICDHT